VPELPDVTVYVEAIAKRIVDQPLLKLRLGNPFVLRTVDPPPSELAGKRVTAVRRLGKRIVIALESDLFITIHLMIAGRFKWLPSGAKLPGKMGLAAFDFPNGTLLLTEAGSKRRASIHIVRGEEAVHAHDPGGIEPLDISLQEFRAALTRERHTLKRTLTDPHVFSGIGNAYSDEILHRARLSPVQMTTNLSDDEMAHLYGATRHTLLEWTDRLRAEAVDRFPEKSLPSAPISPSTAATANPAPTAALPSSTSSTPRTKRTTAPAARREAAYSPTEPYRGFFTATGRNRSMNCELASP
jgi:formamidopyrimidine-DNA glycosylase